MGALAVEVISSTAAAVVASMAFSGAKRLATTAASLLPRPISARISSRELAPELFASFSHSRRSEEHTSELQSLMRISYAVFCLKKKKIQTHQVNTTTHSIKREKHTNTRPTSK